MPEENSAPGNPNNLNNSSSPTPPTNPPAESTAPSSSTSETPSEPATPETSEPSTPETSEPTTPSTAPVPSTPAPSPALKPADTPTPMSSPIMKSKIHRPMNKLFPVVIILALLALAGLGTSIFAFTQSSNKDSEIVRLKNQLASQGVVSPTEPTEPDDNPSDDPATEEITPEIRAKVLSAVPRNLVLGSAKNLNTSHDMLYSINSAVDSMNPAFSVSLDLSTNQASLTLNWDRIKEYYPSLNLTQTGTEDISNFDLSGKPTDLLLTGFGQAPGYETLFFLIEDGTVEYIPLAKATKDSNFKSYGKLPNINNVIKFYSGSSCPADSFTGCGRQSLAQRADGNYYELYDAVKNTGNFDL